MKYLMQSTVLAAILWDLMQALSSAATFWSSGCWRCGYDNVIIKMQISGKSYLGRCVGE